MAIGLCQAKRIVRLRKSSETSEVLAFDCWRHSSTIFPGPLSECSRMDSMSSSQSVEEVAKGGDGSVQSIDPVTGEIGQTIAVGSSPRALAFDALRGRLWVANARSNSVQAIQVGTEEGSPPISVGEL